MTNDNNNEHRQKHPKLESSDRVKKEQTQKVYKKIKKSSQMKKSNAPFFSGKSAPRQDKTDKALFKEYKSTQEMFEKLLLLYTSLKIEMESMKQTHMQAIQQLDHRFKDQERALRKLDQLGDKIQRRRDPSKRERVGLFIDVQNIYYATRKFAKGRHIDFSYLKKAVTRNRRLIISNAYIIQTPEIDQLNFIHVLEAMGYSVHSKSLKKFSDGTAKGDWDMGIAIDIISTISDLDTIALVSGDGDFTSLVKLMKKLDTNVEVYSFEHNLAKELKEVADQHIVLDERFLLPED